MKLIDQINSYYKKYPLIKEIRIGGPCPEDFPLTKIVRNMVGFVPAGAHTHVDENDYKNTICVCNKAFLIPSIVVHEYAHIIGAPDHGPEWQKAISKLGWPGLVNNNPSDYTINYSEIEFE